MDVASKLRALLSPTEGPAIRSQPRSPKPAGKVPPDFAGTLAQASLNDDSIGPFGARRPRPAPGTVSPAIHVGRTTEGVAVGPAGGPTIGPGLPETFDLPIDDQRIEMNDTLETILIRERSTRPANPIDPPEADQPTTPAATPSVPPVVVAGTADEPPATPPSTLPPIGVLWAPEALSGTGRTGHGINGTDGAIAQDLVIKHETYNHPEKYGMTRNLEATLFLDAVEKGYVTNTPEGLGTLLSTLGRGAIGSGGRPAEMTEYFRQFFAATRSN